MTKTVLTVFGSSSPRTPVAYLAAAAELGGGIAARGWVLRNGAGADGCMGAMTDAALAAGGRVEGVNLRTFVDQGFIHPRLEEVRIADTMRQRKEWLGTDCYAYIALPGGPGTWEEVWEVAVERQIGVHRKPLLLCNIDGFWDGFAAMLARAEADSLLYGPAAELVQILDGPAAVLAALGATLSAPPIPSC